MKDVVQLARLEKGGRNWGPKKVPKKTKVKPATRATVNTTDPVVAKLVLEESADRFLGADLDLDPARFVDFEEISVVPPHLTIAAHTEFPDELLHIVPPDISPPEQEELILPEEPQPEESARTKRWKKKKEEEQTVIELDLKAEDTSPEVN